MKELKALAGRGKLYTVINSSYYRDKRAESFYSDDQSVSQDHCVAIKPRPSNHLEHLSNNSHRLPLKEIKGNHLWSHQRESHESPQQFAPHPSNH